MIPSVGRSTSNVGSSASANVGRVEKQEAEALDAPSVAIEAPPLRQTSRVGLSRHELHRSFNAESPLVVLRPRQRRPSTPTPRQIEDRQSIRSSIGTQISDEAKKATAALQALSPAQLDKIASDFEVNGADLDGRFSGLLLSIGLAFTNKVLRQGGFGGPEHAGTVSMAAFESALRNFVGAKNLTPANVMDAVTKLDPGSWDKKLALVSHGVTLAASEGRVDLAGWRQQCLKSVGPADRGNTAIPDRAIVRAGAFAAGRTWTTPHDRRAFEEAMGRAADEHVPGLRSDKALFGRYVAAGVAHLLITGRIDASEIHENYGDVDSRIFGQVVCAEVDAIVEDEGFDVRRRASDVIDDALRRATQRMTGNLSEEAVATSAIGHDGVRAVARSMALDVLIGHQQVSNAEVAEIRDPTGASVD